MEDCEHDAEVARARPLLILSWALIVGSLYVGTPPLSAADPSEEFFRNLQALCSRTYLGDLVSGPSSTHALVSKSLALRIHSCDSESVDAVFYVASQPTERWSVELRYNGLALRHEDLAPDGGVSLSYGGLSRPPGSATEQRFPADEETAALDRAFTSNLWSLRVEPHEELVYNLARDEAPRYFRLRFDLTRPLPLDAEIPELDTDTPHVTELIQAVTRKTGGVSSALNEEVSSIDHLVKEAACLSHEIKLLQNRLFREISANIEPPRLEEKALPEYTREAVEADVEGDVLIDLLIGADGEIVAACPRSSPGSGLVEKALGALRRWRFTPATLAGEPISVRYRVEFRFRLAATV